MRRLVTLLISLGIGSAICTLGFVLVAFIVTSDIGSNVVSETFVVFYVIVLSGIFPTIMLGFPISWSLDKFSLTSIPIYFSLGLACAAISWLVLWNMLGRHAGNELEATIPYIGSTAAFLTVMSYRIIK